MSSHEPLQSHRAVAASSNRAFGLVFAAILAIIGVWPKLRHDEPLRLWALAAAAAFLYLAIFDSARLAPLNRLWFKLGLKMHALVSPLIMGLLFFGAVTPVAVVIRLLGNDLLRLRRDNASSYWIPRETGGPSPGSMKNQF